MKKIYQLGHLALIALFVIGCNKEDALDVSEPLEHKYSLPQGNNDYDQKILDFYNQTGCMLLYEYDASDIRWNITSVDPADPASTTEKLEFYPIYPKPEHLSQGLRDVIWGQWFDHYSIEFLKGRLPRYVFLADSIIKRKINLTEGTEDILTMFLHKTATAMTVGRVGSSFNKLLDREKYDFFQKVNVAFWNDMCGSHRVEAPERFTRGIDYVTVNTKNFTELGILHAYSGGSILTPQSDLANTVNTVLGWGSQAATRVLFTKTSATDTDPKGMRWKRMNIFLEEMKKEYDIDFEKMTKIKNPVGFTNVKAFYDPTQYDERDQLVCFTQPINYGIITTSNYKAEGIIWEGLKAGDLLNADIDFQNTIKFVYGCRKLTDLNKQFYSGTTTSADPNGCRWERFKILFKELKKQGFDFLVMTSMQNPVFDMTEGFGDGMDYSKINNTPTSPDYYKKAGIIWDLGTLKEVTSAAMDFRMTIVKIYETAQTTINSWFTPANDPTGKRKARCIKLTNDLLTLGIDLEAISGKTLPKE